MVSFGLVTWAVTAFFGILLSRLVYQGVSSRLRIRRLISQGIPVLPHSLLFGHLPIFNDFRQAHPPDVNIYVFHHWLMANRERYLPGLESMPPVVYLDLWPFAFQMALVFDAGMAAQFTQTKNAPKSSVLTKFLAPMTSNLDIISTEDTAWKLLKVSFGQTFSPRNIMATLPDLLEEMAVFVHTLEQLVGNNGTWGKVFALEEKGINLTFDLICRILFNVRTQQQSDPLGHPLKPAIYKQLKHLDAMSHPMREVLAKWLPVDSFMAAQNNKAIDAILTTIIRERQQNQPRGPPGSSKRVMIDLSPKASLTGSQIPPGQDPNHMPTLLANIKSFIWAGHETTAFTTCSLVKCLLDNPLCLAKLREEHDRAFGPWTAAAAAATAASSADTIMAKLEASPHILHNLPYTLGVIKETLRLHPVVGSMREAHHPGMVLSDPSSGLQYPCAGFALWVAAPAIHRDPKYWARPSEFIPERWSTADPSDPLFCPAKEAWVPFSLGARSCIGMEFGLTELKLVSIFLTRKFDIREAWDEWDKLNDDNGPPPPGGRNTTTTPIYHVNGQRLYQVGGTLPHPKDGMPVQIRMRRKDV